MMKKREIKDLDLFLYEETLDNGLTIYVIPKENTESIYVTFTTKFGGYHTEFIPREENDFIKVPDGIAHFLEHKMFEQKSGMDVMSQFSKNGVSANASTNLFKTTYLFDGSSFLKENLTLLLDYVQDPYFTDENVEKEKHIIEQEIDMSADNPYQACMQTLMKNLFVKDPSKVPTIGTKKSINEITKEDLYTCYQTFYHPKNMFLVVTGNIDPKEIIELVKENQKKKTFEPFKEPVLKTYDEPTSVFKEKEERFMKITVPKLALGYKFDLHALKEKLGMSDVQIRRYLSIYANLKFGAVSPFLESARKDMVITSTVDYSIYSTDDHIILMLMADTKNPEELIHRIEEELKNEEIEERLFNLKKKGMIASTIYMSENIYSMNQKVMGDIIDHQDVEVDVLSSFKALDYESFMNVISSLQFNHRSISFVRPEKSEE